MEDASRSSSTKNEDGTPPFVLDEAEVGIAMTIPSGSADMSLIVEHPSETNDSQQPETDSLLSVSQSESDTASKTKSKTPSRAFLAPEVTHIPIQSSDVVEYEWPQKTGVRFFLQEQISELLGINSFKRKYPEMARRTVEPVERDYLLGELKVNIALPSHHLTAFAIGRLCNERLKRVLLEKQKEMEMIKLDAKKMAELRQKAVKSASEFNSELQFIRKTERQQFWEMNTNVIHSPLNKWMRLSAEHSKPSKYPVFLMPGQYTTHYTKFDSAQLRSFPFGSVVKSDGLFLPKRGPSPPAISISEKELEAAKNSNERKEVLGPEKNASPKSPQKEREIGPPPAKLPRMTVSISWANSSPKMPILKTNAPEPRSRVQQSASQQKPHICSVCQLADPSPAHKALLIRCSACHQQMHSSCIDMPLNMVEVIRKYEWLCIECKRCSVCEQPDQEAAMMCCDACDRGYHTFCIGLEMPPNGTWHCPECKAMDEQLRKRYLNVLTVKESKPGERRQKMPYLDLKSSTREAFVERNFKNPKRGRGEGRLVRLKVYFQLFPMSSISSGVDLNVKYQRLAVEFVKVRNQISVLKTALLAEQSKSADLGKELALGETRLFRLENERDSLLFRNDQLLKRVESLQEGMDAQQATFDMAKGKKKHKEANLRLVAESSRMHQQALSGATASDPLSVLEGELERKIAENGELHSKLFDVERRFDDTVTAYIRRIDDLEKENEALKDANTPSAIAKQNFDSNGQSPLTETNDSTADGFLCSSHNLVAVSVVPQSPGDRTIDGKPSDSGLSSSFGDRTEPESFEHNDTSGDTTLTEKYSVERMSALGKSLHHATGRATYYKQECEELLRKAISDQTHIGTLESHNSELATKCRLLNDSLETTQINYEARFRELHEHLVEQQSKITAQTDRTLLFNCGGTANHQQKSGERSVENGGRAKKNEKAPRSNWFSSSTSSK
ncbi:hypothetical protein GPALN_012933 [Globodera pallida]|nr:hypothetical protein GPALN_012933 [Globodera pallida]